MTTQESIKFTAIDLFSCSGAVTQGLKSEGFSIVAAVDTDTVACSTYRSNHPEVLLIERDIRDICVTTLRDQLNLQDKLDLLVVCAPCQPFSNHNKKRSLEDPRADLILECIKFVNAFMPRVILFENVPGIAVIGPLQTLAKKLEGLGYVLEGPKNLDAADYGVPQRRERCIMLAAENRDVIGCFYDAITLQPRITVRQALSGLKSLSSGERDPTDALHFARNHRPVALQRLRHIPKDGGSRTALPPELELACHKGRKNDFPDVYGRMKWDDVAPTLTTGCTDVTKGRYGHPIDDRAISLREAALLQSFPLDYKFIGKPGQIARQIGNAVPVAMARTLARLLKDLIRSMRKDERLDKGC